MHLPNQKYLYLLCLGHFSVDINSGSLPALLPFFVSNYGMNYADIAGIMFGYSFLSSLVQPAFGYLADKGSRQWFMVLGILMTSLAFAVLGFVQSYWSIFAFAVIMGIGSSIFHPEGARNVTAVSGREKGKAVSIFSVGGNAGFGLGPLLIVFLVSLFGMRGTLFYAGMGLVLAGILGISIPAIRRAGQSSGAADDPAVHSVETPAPAAKNDWSAFAKLFLSIFFCSTLMTGINSFLPMYCIQALGTSEAVGSATLSIFALMGIAATLIGGWLADRHGYVNTMRLCCWVAVPVFAAIAFSGSIYAIYAMLIPLSLALRGQYSSTVVLGQSYLSKNIGFASGITLGVSFSIGGIIVPFLGHYADAFGIQALFTLLVVFSVLGALATMLLPKHSNAQNL
ncbi:MAG: MFS transporter [Selenomonadaceae bacterium]|nr:MFS transporter [Selenomonadaceae bacterium]